MNQNPLDMVWKCAAEHPPAQLLVLVLWETLAGIPSYSIGLWHEKQGYTVPGPANNDASASVVMPPEGIEIVAWAYLPDSALVKEVICDQVRAGHAPGPLVDAV
jgi:hypothetical protein